MEDSTHGREVAVKWCVDPSHRGHYVGHRYIPQDLAPEGKHLRSVLVGYLRSEARRSLSIEGGSHSVGWWLHSAEGHLRYQSAILVRGSLLPCFRPEPAIQQGPTAPVRMVRRRGPARGRPSHPPSTRPRLPCCRCRCHEGVQANPIQVNQVLEAGGSN